MLQFSEYNTKTKIMTQNKTKIDSLWRVDQVILNPTLTHNLKKGKNKMLDTDLSLQMLDWT